jgi:hypothetical protein
MRKLLVAIVLTPLISFTPANGADFNYPNKTYKQGYDLVANWIKKGSSSESWYSPSTGKLVTKNITAWCKEFKFFNGPKFTPNAVNGCVAAIKKFG